MSEHTIYEATVRQVNGLVAERDALREQIAGLVAERDAQREHMASLVTKLAQARQTADTWRRAYIGDGVAPE